MNAVVTGDAWVSICCVCGDYFDSETKEKIEEPPPGVAITHTYCDSCFDDAMLSLASDMEKTCPVVQQLDQAKREAN